MDLLKRIAVNVSALALAAAIGTVAVSQVAYHHEIPVGAVPVAPLIRGFLVSIILAGLAPKTSFAIRFYVFTGVYLLDLVISVFASAAAVELVNTYFDGDPQAARPWTQGGLVIPFITGAAGWWILRRNRV